MLLLFQNSCESVADFVVVNANYKSVIFPRVYVDETGQWQLNQPGEEESGSFSRLHNSTQKPEDISAMPKEVIEYDLLE